MAHPGTARPHGTSASRRSGGRHPRPRDRPRELRRPRLAAVARASAYHAAATRWLTAMKPFRAAGLAFLLLLSLCAIPAHAARPVVVVVRLQDTIQPISEDYFDRG